MTIGKVRNGERIVIESTFYNGPAGVQRLNGVVEAAYIGTGPETLPADVVILSAVLGRRTAKVINQRVQNIGPVRTTLNMTVLTIELDPVEA